MKEIRILIPEKMYAGAQSVHGTASVTSALTAWGTDSGAKSRLATLHQLVGGEGNARVLDNTPLYGFELYTPGPSDEWWIRDPRGFMVLVKNSMLHMLLSTSTLVDGVIQHACCWGRHGGCNVLLNVDSELYREAQAATRVANMKANWKDAKVGNMVTLQNGTQGVYLGKYHGLMKDYLKLDSGVDNKSENQLIPSDPVYVILKDIAEGFSKKSLLLIQNPKLAEIDSSISADDKESEQQVNQYLVDTNILVQNHTRSRGTTMVLSRNKFDETNIKLGIVDVIQDPQEIRQEIAGMKSSNLHGHNNSWACRTNNGKLIHLQSMGRRNRTNNAGTSSNTIYFGYPVSEQDLTLNHLKYELEFVAAGRFGQGSLQMKCAELELGDIKELMRIQVEVNTGLGNQIKINI